MTTEDQASDRPSAASRNERVFAMREAGASWKEIEEAFSLTRQQARYAYQLARRAHRRQARGEAN